MSEIMSGKTVVVTGASSGIGANVTEQLLNAGATVIGLDRASESSASQHITVDLSDESSIDRTIAAIEGPIDGLCNIAGVSGNAGADLTMRVNFLGLRALTEGLAPRIERGGAIVNIASIAGSRWAERTREHVSLARTTTFSDGLKWLEANPIQDDTAYSYSKEAVVVWSRILTTRLLSAGVRVNAVSPGPVETPILTQFREVFGHDHVQEDITRVGRPGTPADVAPVVVWLCSDGSRWVNGADIAADGGLAATFAPGSEKN
ncbi:coniferyl-alcohol dehydrogenase [Rhodococcus opacus]|uniref:coniferyl-alcohol dehydrogenase n=1 Tax=Rhodococcus opacus TaxID=37919 RepID=UPI001C4829AA|nr:coniferyl-alcohol dehydrogenase [Rhodococcus opacus]MBV6760243.1 coniferyl-alcohol dehydrogenase [Rhodococcus opacus]